MDIICLLERVSVAHKLKLSSHTDIWRYWYHLPAFGTYIFIYSTPEGCYYSLTVYQGTSRFTRHKFVENYVLLAILLYIVFIDYLSWRVGNYLQEATELGKKAKELKKAADALRQEEKNGAKGRKWRKNVKAVEKVLFLRLIA